MPPNCNIKSIMAIFSVKVTIKVTWSLTMVSFERVSLFACQIWSIVLLYTALNSPSLIFALWWPKTDSLQSWIRPLSNFPNIILYIQFSWPSFKFALRPEGEKGENKTGAKISLYTVSISYNSKFIAKKAWNFGIQYAVCLKKWIKSEFQNLIKLTWKFHQSSSLLCLWNTYAPNCNIKSIMAIFSVKVTIKVTWSLTMVSFERVSLFACQIWSIVLSISYNSKFIAKIKFYLPQTDSRHTDSEDKN